MYSALFDGIGLTCCW